MELHLLRSILFDKTAVLSQLLLHSPSV